MNRDLDQTSRAMWRAVIGSSLASACHRLLQASSGASLEDCRLLGRCVGRLEKQLRNRFARVSSRQELQILSVALLHEPVLESQIMAAYLFARRHSLAPVEEVEPTASGRAAVLTESLGDGLPDRVDFPSPLEVFVASLTSPETGEGAR